MYNNKKNKQQKKITKNICKFKQIKNCSFHSNRNFIANIVMFF